MLHILFINKYYIILMVLECFFFYFQGRLHVFSLTASSNKFVERDFFEEYLPLPPPTLDKGLLYSKEGSHT
jgi:hypothetical protein